MNLTVNQLRLIVAVAETSSFVEAGRRASLTQPAVTRAIKQAEATLGVQLFRRTTRRVSLTADGEELVAVARRIVGEFDDGMSRFQSYREGHRGRLRIAALPSLAAGVLAEPVAQFVRDRPLVELEIVTGSSRYLLDALRTGAADLAVTDDPGAAGALTIARLLEDEMVVLLPRDHELAQAGQATWTQLAAEAFVKLGTGTSVRGLTDEGFAIAGTEPSRTITVDAIPAVAALVSSGLGVSAVPRSVRSLIADSGLVTIPLREPDISRTIVIAVPAEPKRTPAAERFAATLIGHFATPPCR